MPTAFHRAARVFPGHPAIGYLVAFVSVGLATALQWWAGGSYLGAPFITIYPAVVITAFVVAYNAAGLHYSLQLPARKARSLGWPVGSKQLSAAQPLTGVENVVGLIRLGDKHAAGNTALGVDHPA